MIPLSNALPEIKQIAEKICQGERLSPLEGILLYEKADTGLLGTLANTIKEEKYGAQVYYIRNFHIEPTNICVYNCRFCSYSRKKGAQDAWEYSLDEMAAKAKQYQDQKISEVHIVGGAHPDWDINYYARILETVRGVLPLVHIKAFSAVELDYAINKSGLSLNTGLQLLRNAGLDSIPGGGAEIFDETLREKICPEKTGSARWLEIHKMAHQVGIPSNATMLYGHLENYKMRIDHLNRLRELQDKTGGFNAFIPLKYHRRNNPMGTIQEVTSLEDMRNYAVSRIFLDNIPHIKAYWPMLGKEMTQLSLSFGADDVDGTIDDSTKIYTMAGAKEQSPCLSETELRAMITSTNRVPVERDALYRMV